MVIRLGPGEKRVIQKGRDFVFEGKKQEGYTMVLVHHKLKQWDTLARRLIKRTLNELPKFKEPALKEFFEMRRKNAFGAINPAVPMVDAFILKNLRISPQTRAESLAVLRDEALLTTCLAFAPLRQRVPRREIIPVVQRALAYFDALSSERKKELLTTGYNHEKVKQWAEKLARSGAKEYLPEEEYIMALKYVNTAHNWDVLGEDAAQVYKRTYAAVKDKIARIILE